MADVTADQFQEWVVGTIGEWLPGYTDRIDKGPQFKITHMDSDEELLVMKVEPWPSHEFHMENEKTFIIRVEVREVPSP